MNLSMRAKRILIESLIVAAITELIFFIDCLNDLTPFTGAYYQWARQFYGSYTPFTYVVWILPVALSLLTIKNIGNDSTDGGFIIAALVFVIAYGFVFFFPFIVSAVAIAVLIYAPLDILIEKRTIRLLEEEKPYDMGYLYKKGFVHARATGYSITQIYAEVENLLSKKIRVVIEPGTYFVAKGNYQNMVVKEEYSFTLMPNNSHSVSMNAACINAGSPIPGVKDKFNGVKKVSRELRMFLAASTKCPAMVVQAGVWAITDSYTESQVINRLFVQDRYGNRRQAVTTADVAEARKILNELGIRNRL